ncbi:MAG: translation initiation factor IF-2 subunit alpha [Candidatus Altiarchaeota archaeon]|nr:translation initiation factor IF-2 subunit alpha [Candidatus Altiarchaeota archaeon]
MQKTDDATKGGEYPEAGEYVIGTVQNIFRQGAFITLDEYKEKKGMLHLSEISLKWVRNIRDYVREGQKVVLVVLGVNPERGHIDLSLRRVTDAKRKEKLQQIKQKQRAEKFFELLAKELKSPPEEVDKKIVKKLSKDYKSVYEGLESISSDEKNADRLSLDPEWRKTFVNLVKKNIKPPFVYIAGYVELRSYELDGVKTIKESLKKIEGYEPGPDSKIEVTYISPPMYRIKIRSRDYKSAERILKNAAEEGIKNMRKKGSTGEFHRNMEDIQK